MMGSLERHLDECRRRGLHVDEDFETDRHRAARLFPLALLVAIAAALIAVTVALSHRPESSQSRQPHHRTIFHPPAPRAYV
jgi:hypothetical protein